MFHVFADRKLTETPTLDNTGALLQLFFASVVQRALCAIFSLLPLAYGKFPLVVAGFRFLGFSRRRFVW